MPDNKENIRSKKRKRTGSKKKELQPCEFHDYACAKSFDILSKGKRTLKTLNTETPKLVKQKISLYFTHNTGMYKKFLAQSNVSGEEWASKVMDSVVKVQDVVARIHTLIGNLQLVEMGGVNTKALADACAQVGSMCVMCDKTPAPGRAVTLEHGFSGCRDDHAAQEAQACCMHMLHHRRQDGCRGRVGDPEEEG